MLNPDNTIFVILSFEGPDVYSQAGGLGVRASELSRALAEAGFYTHLFFIGDPRKDAEEHDMDGHLILHRWCQWISRHHPNGVYQGEGGKIHDYENSVPDYLIHNIIRQAAHEGKEVVVLAEEWHTAQTVINLHNYLSAVGLRDSVVMFWNANNTYGFWNINWPGLKNACTITTVSRYMKHLMWERDVNAMVIPNGIPRRLLNPLDPRGLEHLQSVFHDMFFLLKVGRYSPDKRWIMAIDSLAHLKYTGHKAVMVMRGGMEPHRADVYHRAAYHNLDIRELKLSDTSFDSISNALRQNRDADLIELNFFLPEEFLRYLYGSADSVLANSGHEPFGLVGLEVMATGGIAIVGASGEDYAQAFQNCIVVEGNDPREISSHLLYLADNPQMVGEMRANARQTAYRYTWDKVMEDLLGKIEFISRVFNVLPL
jgi:glycosyltransferase involved in cell wall biosynthesis